MENPPIVHIRDAVEEERETIADMMVEAYQQYADVLPVEAWNAYRDSIRQSAFSSLPYARIVAELNGTIVGTVQLYLSSETAYGKPEMGIHSPIIRLLAVSPAARGLGIAKLLIQEAAQRSIELGATTLNLHTSDMMADAVRLYEKLGFQRDYPTDTTNGLTLVKGYRLDLPGSALLTRAIS
ncbi:GNAT family N-acetyltransferase [Paenibacillus sp. JX-17]|uniref:GNAT family N-acetyltransferase n=1 Tax=Paenibacillus lacisoli TaxID=3064525 RepID=A0ABT9CHG5_9BACL|nr:GNAT family N-acetyltransferase [Paenibacillus sp. JX-17]MDO7908018.1 GNAT family N-acetyltransferase [Paenibacillus sp. JX-17]